MAVTALSGTLLLHRQMERFLLSAYPTRWPEKERSMPVTTWYGLVPGQQMFRINISLQRAEYESFLKTFKQLPDSLEEFSIDSWNSLVEYATVYSADDIRFTFKNGQEIKA